MTGPTDAAHLFRDDAEPALAIIGGSGLSKFDGLADAESIDVLTPFGKPSAAIVEGYLGETRVLFLARHGTGHTILPSDVNYRANIYALKLLGAKWCVGVGAVGSLSEKLRPGQICIPSQLIDRTVHRRETFFGEGICAHVSMAEPFCPALRERLRKFANPDAADSTYICIEGPSFSTRAESEIYRDWGADLIGMTCATEAKLAREAELSYAILALITDYDSWHTETEPVSTKLVIETLRKLSETASSIVVQLSADISDVEPPEFVGEALKSGLLTDLSHAGPEARARLEAILGKYLS
jgi:5'-methylthioadenosine phosphorylase